ncbi:hypothetical protein DF186_25305, partial [Enterococcus hirae]
EVVVFGSDWIGTGVEKDYRVANGEKKFVSVVVRGYVERMVYMYGVGFVGSYKVVYYIFQLGMCGRMVVVRDILEGVV